jgi:hypothetical protein
MAKLFLILFTIMITGCASQPYVVSTEPDFRSPAQVRADRGYADNKSSGGSTISTVNLPSGSYLVSRQGNTVTAIQTSRTKR